MGKRHLIYVPKESVWDSIKEQAWLNRKSVSQYLISLHERYLSEGVDSHSEFVTTVDEVKADFEKNLDVEVDRVKSQLKEIKKKQAIPEQDWRITKTSYSKGDSVDPGGTGKKSKMK